MPGRIHWVWIYRSIFTVAADGKERGIFSDGGTTDAVGRTPTPKGRDRGRSAPSISRELAKAKLARRRRSQGKRGLGKGKGSNKGLRNGQGQGTEKNQRVVKGKASLEVEVSRKHCTRKGAGQK